MKTEKDYTIKHILNNNSVIVDGYLNETILIGKGLGFGRKANEILESGVEYEKQYQLLNKASEFSRIVNGYDERIVEMVMDTIQQIMSQNSDEFTMNDFVTIADHLAAMFERVLKGEAILSFFSHETRTLYPASFAKANDIARLIDEDHGVSLPEAEIAYIALYLENLISSKSKKEVEKMSVIIESIRDILEEQNALIIDKELLAYSRFLIHINMIVKSSTFTKSSLSPTISKAILSTYTEYAKIGKQIIGAIEEEVDHKLSESELVYIIIHLVNLFEPR